MKNKIMQKYEAKEITQDQAIDQLTEAFQAGEVSREDLNAGLKELAAGYSFKAMTEEERGAKRLREDAEGFFEPEDRGLERKPVYPDKPDMSRNKDHAGGSVIQHTKQGVYEVWYNEDGYAVKAVRK